MDAYIGEIRAFPFSFVPAGWLGCYGQTVNVYQYQALYTLLGNTYGGTPNQTFVLPNMQTLAPIGQGTGTGLTPRTMGHTYGAASVALTSANQLPAHVHTLSMQVPVAANLTKNTQTTPTASASWLARTANVTSDTVTVAVPSYTKNTGQAPNTTLMSAAMGYTGGNSNGTVTPHENRQPYLPLVFCICTDGIYPIYN